MLVLSNISTNIRQVLKFLKFDVIILSATISMMNYLNIKIKLRTLIKLMFFKSMKAHCSVKLFFRDE